MRMLLLAMAQAAAVPAAAQAEMALGNLRQRFATGPIDWAAVRR